MLTSVSSKPALIYSQEITKIESTILTFIAVIVISKIQYTHNNVLYLYTHIISTYVRILSLYINTTKANY